MGSCNKSTSGARFHNFDALRTVSGDAESQPPVVLVLGGSTFMGRELVQALLARPARVCVVNRGRSYWGTDDPSEGRAARLVCDRRDADEFAAALDAATSRAGGRWALVADFSAYNGTDVRAALAGLRGRFDVYAYISSDSVYEVSAWAGEGWPSREAAAGGPRAVAEGASVRPDDEKARKRLRRADAYGDGKLLAEEALASGIAGDPAAGRGVALRLPDVIGPFDDTLRLWAYWHWLHAGPADPPQVPGEASPCKRPRTEAGGTPAKPDAPEGGGAPLALVFSRDVARFIAGLVGSEAAPGGPRFDAVNLACREQLPLRGLLGLFAKAAGLQSPPALAAAARPKSFLPSVDRPWRLSLDHMRDAYDFEPTPLERVLEVCSRWFSEGCAGHPREALRAAMKLPPGARAAAIKRAALEAARSSSGSSSDGEPSSSSGGSS